MIGWQVPPAADGPELTVSATLTARWSASRLDGGIALAGMAGRPGTLRAVARDARLHALASATVTADADGRFRTRLRLPARMAPGTVSVTVDEPAPPAGLAPLPPRAVRLRLVAPPEGVVGRVALTRRRAMLVLVARFAAPPRAGLALRVELRRPDGGVRTVTGPALRGHVLTARIRLARPAWGRWRVTVVAGDRAVVRATRVFRPGRGG